VLCVRAHAARRLSYYVSLRSDLIREASNFEAMEQNIKLASARESKAVGLWKRRMQTGNDELRSQKLEWAHFAESKYDAFLGIENAKRGMARKWMSIIDAIIASVMDHLLQRREKEFQRLQSLEAMLAQQTESNVRKQTHAYILKFCTKINNFLDGDLDVMEDLGSQKVGETLEQETSNFKRSRFHDVSAKWDVTDTPVDEPHLSAMVSNMHLGLYGGSQYSRLLEYFTALVHTCEFPQFDNASLASALGELLDDNDFENYERVVVKMTQRAARKVLQPSIDWLARRSAYIMQARPAAAWSTACDRNTELSGVGHRVGPGNQSPQCC
jgi:hypothetical protein